MTLLGVYYAWRAGVSLTQMTQEPPQENVKAEGRRSRDPQRE